MITDKDFENEIKRVGEIQYSQHGQSVRNVPQAATACFELAEKMREDFAVWYSGMERNKVKRAVERYKVETKNK